MQIKRNAEHMLQKLYQQAPADHRQIAYWIKIRELGKMNSKSLNLK